MLDSLTVLDLDSVYQAEYFLLIRSHSAFGLMHLRLYETVEISLNLP